MSSVAIGSSLNSCEGHNSNEKPIVVITPKKEAPTGESEVLFNAMTVSSRNCFQRDVVLAAFSGNRLKHRLAGVEWIRKIISKDTSEMRDSAVQIFHSYLVMTFLHNPKMEEDLSFIFNAATASMILSTKLHSSSHHLTAMHFPGLQLDELLIFERDILMKTGCRMSSLATPSYFVDFVISLCPEKINKPQLLQMVNAIIGEFWEDAASILFAPSTIAISAVIVSFSVLRMDCSKLVDSLPEFLLPNRSYPFFLEEDGKNMYLDLDSCIKAMEDLAYIRSTYMTRSPNSIADDN